VDVVRSHGCLPLAGADLHRIVDRNHENPPVAGVARVGVLPNGFDHRLDQLVRHHDFQLGLHPRFVLRMDHAETTDFRDGYASTSTIFGSNQRNMAGNTTSVRMLDVITPPMTTVASGRCTSAPAPTEMAIGRKPRASVVAVISTGRRRSMAPR